MRVLVIDIGGSNVKLAIAGHSQQERFTSGPRLTPARMVAATRRLTRGWNYDAISIGYPGPVRAGKILTEPKNLGKGWLRYNFAKRLRKPVVIINDAAMQALGSYDGGRMLFIGLGTGLGSALIVDGAIVPLELSELRYTKSRTMEDHLAKSSLKKMGRRKWEREVHLMLRYMQKAFVTDYIVVGGGNSKKLGDLPPGVRRGKNAFAFRGGRRLWGAGPGKARYGNCNLLIA